ncbi:hypothetical protein KAF80_13415 [Bacillus sp. WL1]|uniref:hypothetical protein n=1 Tax=Bacillus sp. WL1 TaxID=2822693 RepID=UPI001B330753|nr:hypothetical protein [Bacillus sp. WL1]MBP3970036.1 hypothetical protein [Bacillus sp. WL1]
MSVSIWINVNCECGTEMKIKPPKEPIAMSSELGRFVLNCPYCEGELGEFDLNFRELKEKCNEQL